jgi:hypothetical protein
MAKKAAKPKPRKKRQEHLPTMEPEKIPAIHNAAIAYEEARSTHVAATKQRNAAAEKLIEAMQKAGKTVYIYGDISAEIDDTIKVRVKIKSAEAASEEEDASEE